MRLIFDKLGITGFRSDSITPISCIAYSNKKAWILTVNPHFPFDKFDSILIVEVITNILASLLRCRDVSAILLVDF